MQNKRNLILIIFSILLLSCASLMTNCAPQNTENSRTDEPTAVVMQAASETPSALPTATNTVEPSPTNTIEPTPTHTLEPTPTEVVMVDFQDTFVHRANLARTGVYHSLGPKETPSVAWEFAAGDAVFSEPTICDGVAYFGSYSGNFYAVDIKTGEALWTFTSGDAVLSSPALVDGILYFGSSDGKLYALDADSGEEVWAFETGGRVISSPAVSEGMVYFGSYDGFLYALDSQTGEAVWTFEVAGIVDTESGISKAIAASPAISENVVLFGSTQVGGASAELFFYGLDSQTGEKLWEFASWNDLTSPVVYEGAAYFGGFASFYGLDIETGALVLDFDTDIVITDPAIYEGIAYYGSESGLVFALDLTSGETLWVYDTASYYGLRTPSVSDGVVYIGSSDGFILALDYQTGDVLWEYRVAEVFNTSPVIYGGVLYMGANGDLFALN